MGCDTKSIVQLIFVWLETEIYIILGLKSYPEGYVAVDSHKSCLVRIYVHMYVGVCQPNLIWQEGQGTDNRPSSGQINCLCDTDDCNANQYAAPGAAPKVRSDPES